MSKTKMAIFAFGALAAMSLSAGQAFSQQLCLNAVPRSLNDSSTENSDARIRIDALGNRCVVATGTGQPVTQQRVESFLSSNPDQNDNIQYGNGRIVRPR